jgi:UDP-N-acetylmuramoylalanine--D-glutamate ligase
MLTVTEDGVRAVEMNRAPYRAGSRVSVLGAARSGIAAAILLSEEGYKVFVSDVSTSEETRRAKRELEERGVEVCLGDHPLQRIQASAFVVPSPGIPEEAPVMLSVRDAGLAVYSEIEVAGWFTKAPIAAITGTNGKTTTVNLIGTILDAAGRENRVCGNIGNPLSAVCRNIGAEGWLIVEVSSFQLRHIRDFRPTISAILNIMPDHMDRYETFEAYVEDKRRILVNQRERDILFYDGADPVISPLLSRFRGEAVPIFLREEGKGVYRKGAAIVWHRGGKLETLFNRDDLPLPGDHNLRNAMTAAAAVRRMGVAAEEIGPALRGFKGLEHRLEEVACVKGVRFINDSKATNPAAVKAALDTYRGEIVLIVGGKEKGLDYSGLKDDMAGKVKHIISIGECAKRVVDEVAGDVPATISGTMREAVRTAFDAAAGKGIVLLSPGTSSYDMYRDFEERGFDFKAEVVRLQRER